MKNDLFSGIIADRIKSEREREGMKITQAELARRANAFGASLTRRAVMSIELRERAVSAVEILQIAAALNVAPCLLLSPLDDDRGRWIELGEVTLSAPELREWIKGNDHPFPAATVKERYAFFWERVPASWHRARDLQWKKAKMTRDPKALRGAATKAVNAAALFEMVTNPQADLFWRPDAKETKR